MRTMKITSFLTVALLLSTVGCARLSDEELMKGAEKALAERDTTLAIRHYETIVQDRKESPLRVKALYILGGVYQARRTSAMKAVETFQKLISEYPDNEKAANSLFLIGFIYNNDLKDFTKAKREYEEFLAKYPNHEMANSTKFELEYLGKDPSDILKAEPAVSEKVAERKSSSRR